jgi:hypothetical protein
MCSRSNERQCVKSKVSIPIIDILTTLQTIMSVFLFPSIPRWPSIHLNHILLLVVLMMLLILIDMGFLS